ncbi:unnamed protein product, partial [Staurois parvus]
MSCQSAPGSMPPHQCPSMLPHQCHLISAPQFSFISTH